MLESDNFYPDCVQEHTNRPMAEHLTDVTVRCEFERTCDLSWKEISHASSDKSSADD